MHEMSLAIEILNIVEATAQNHNAARVKDIFIDVGQLAGVMIPSLEFGLDIAKQRTCASEADIHIHTIDGQGQCPACQGIFPMGSPIEACPSCSNGFLRMTAGNELRVREIEIEKGTA